MNINEEGKYYASMVRKFRTEYKSKNFMGSVKSKLIDLLAHRWQLATVTAGYKFK